MSFVENREFLEQYYINCRVNIGHEKDIKIIDRIVLSLAWNRWYHKESQEFIDIRVNRVGIFKFVLQ